MGCVKDWIFTVNLYDCDDHLFGMIIVTVFGHRFHFSYQNFLGFLDDEALSFLGVK